MRWCFTTYYIALLCAVCCSEDRHDQSTEAELLSWYNPRIFLHRSFLSHAECDMLIDMAKKSSQYNPSTPGDLSVYLENYPNLPTAVQKIERRIGAVTGVPPHPYEGDTSPDQKYTFQMTHLLQSCSRVDQCSPQPSASS
jgi:hypothetical protein